MKQTKTLIPLELQFFAEGDGGTIDSNPEITVTPVTAPELETVPPGTDKIVDDDKGKDVDVQALLTELAKTKRALDKASSEAASYKKQYKQTLSEKEQYDMEAAEAKAKHDEEFEALKAKVAISELKDKFVTLGYSVEQATTAARAEYEGDIDTVLKIQLQARDEQMEAMKQKIMSEMPQPNIGVGNTGGKQYTKEDFTNMTMIEKSELLHENKEEYERLLNL